MKDFDYEVLQKKRLARNASKGRNGHGYSTALTPPPLTNKEIKQMNGPVYTINYRKPYTFQELKKFPPEMQKKYLEHIIGRFDIRLNSVGYMLGISDPSAMSHKNKDIWHLEVKRGGKPKKAAIDEFRKWVNAGGDMIVQEKCTETAEIAPEKCEDEKVEDKIIPINIPEKPKTVCDDIHLAISGKADPGSILQRFMSMMTLIPNDNRTLRFDLKIWEAEQ